MNWIHVQQEYIFVNIYKNNSEWTIAIGQVPHFLIY